MCDFLSQAELHDEERETWPERDAAGGQTHRRKSAGAFVWHGLIPKGPGEELDPGWNTTSAKPPTCTTSHLQAALAPGFVLYHHMFPVRVQLPARPLSRFPFLLPSCHASLSNVTPVTWSRRLPLGSRVGSGTYVSGRETHQNRVHSHVDPANADQQTPAESQAEAQSEGVLWRRTETQRHQIIHGDTTTLTTVMTKQPLQVTVT